jgi:hypothetical protein
VRERYGLLAASGNVDGGARRRHLHRRRMRARRRAPCISTIGGPSPPRSRTASRMPCRRR